MRCALILTIAVSLWLVETEVHADETALVLVVDPALPHCPNESALRELVSARLGRDPFAAQDGGVTARVELRREGRHAIAVVQFVASDGTLLGTRRLGPASTRCTEIAEVVAATLAVAMEELAATDAPPASADTAGPIETTSAIETPTMATLPDAPALEEVEATEEPPIAAYDVEQGPAAQAAATEPAAHVAVAGGVAIGWQPDVVGQVALEVGLEARDWSAVVDIRVQSAAGTDAGRAGTSWVGAGLIGCGRIDWLSLCGVGVLGRMSGTGSNVDVSRHASATTFGLGVSASVELRPTEWLGLSFRGEVVGEVVRPNIVLDGRIAWDPLPVAAVIEIVAAFRTR